MPLEPEQYSTTSVYELLQEAARGRLGLDHRWVHSIVDRGQAAVADLVRFGLEDHEDDPIDLEEDLIAMLRYLGSPEAIPFYIECVRRHAEDFEDELMAAFLELGQASLDPLLDLYRELGAEEGGEVAFVLASLRIRDPRVLQLLVDRIPLDPGDAAIALGLYGDPAARTAIESALAALNPEDPESEWHRRELRDTLETLDETRPEPQLEPFDLWSLFPEKANPPIGVLSERERLDFLSSSSAEHRESAASSFINTELSETVRDRLFDLAENDPDSKVRAACWKALADAADETQIRKAMLARLKDESVPIEERCGALIGLSLQTEDPTVRKRMEEFYEIPEARASALEAMWRSLDRAFAHYFPPHLDDPDVEIRRQAIWGVGYLAIYGEVGRLRKYFEDEDLREDALFAYALAVPAEISRGRIRGVLRKIEKDAGGLTDSETEMVQVALDQRLAFHGYDPVFGIETEEAEMRPLGPPSEDGERD
ncbi:MAG: HEAT repeat domain-containing protein [Bryobacteraceae bacterium]